MKPIALIDLDGTLADYDSAMHRHQRRLQAPGEAEYTGRYDDGQEPKYIECRRKLIQRLPGFWLGLHPLPLGFEVLDLLLGCGFSPHILTKGPRSCPEAWGEKIAWCAKFVPPQAHLTVTTEKSNVDGAVLFDDYPPYFEAWLAIRPHALVICPPHPWNQDYAPGGTKARADVVRYQLQGRKALGKRLDFIRERWEREAGVST